MNDVDKLKHNFQKFKESGIVDTDDLKLRDEAFERFCQKGIPNLKQEHWRYSPLSKDLNNFDQLIFSKNSDSSFDENFLEPFEHYKILFKDGFLVAGTSPKAWAFFPLIFPQFINFETNYVIQFLILIITYVVLDFLSLICYAILANKLIDWLKANPKTINTISACVLFSIGVFIALTQQY